ncbi:response regulator transcription factor [Paenibacillus sp. GCM10012306]|uniref:response regulator transcription factor n=1 Tax=Paenibacillus sp. GCM10012306 TaxID=3317342 RepID=UPI0036104BCB
MIKVLLVEQVISVARVIASELEHELYSVTIAKDGVTGLQLAQDEEWDIIILSLKLPERSGIELCRQIRSMKQTPIIIIGARNNFEDKINSLENGADDYIFKPLSTRELLARMKSLLRRTGASRGEVLVLGNIELDIEGCSLKKNNHGIKLTKREFEILLALMKNRGRVMTREMLLESIWGYDSDVDTKIIDVYISYLRSKIDEVGQPSVVQTMRGIGYIIRN